MHPLRSRLTPAVIVALVGVLLVGAGVVWFAAAGPASFGVFAYAPLSDTVSIPGVVLVDSRRGLALAVVVIGAILLSASAGYAVGRRRQPPTPPQPPTPAQPS